MIYPNDSVLISISNEILLLVIFMDINRFLNEMECLVPASLADEAPGDFRPLGRARPASREADDFPAYLPFFDGERVEAGPARKK